MVARHKFMWSPDGTRLGCEYCGYAPPQGQQADADHIECPTGDVVQAAPAHEPFDILRAVRAVAVVVTLCVIILDVVAGAVGVATAQGQEKLRSYADLISAMWDARTFAVIYYCIYNYRI
ncbi:Uncharacterized protein PBTT_10401 [Plasmodiophora brassicae]|uniref:Uncharacterized protein n=1 Tax=Plasmodiophora brassicae TaxID=37360 RepID=A0A0G4ILQ3_PLABS|nr:hypothetical protein PBRA_009710 [Plasmodiophora brassicae]